MPFKPGQSGNPGGRPREIGDVVAAAREHTVAAVERLAHWMRSDDPRASPAASIALLDRGWGKPMQPNEHTGADGAPLIPTLSVVISRE